MRAFADLVYKGILPEYLEDSVVRLAVGASTGMAIGIPLGVLVGLSRRAHAALWPVLLFFQAIGDIAWLPILLSWFGFGLATMTFVIVYTVLFPVVLNTVLGVRSVPVDLHRAALSLGASRPRILWEVVIPGALPNIITGLRNGLGYGWRALIAAEMIVGTSGVGFLMFDARRAGELHQGVGGALLRPGRPAWLEFGKLGPSPDLLGPGPLDPSRGIVSGSGAIPRADSAPRPNLGAPKNWRGLATCATMCNVAPD